MDSRLEDQRRDRARLKEVAALTRQGNPVTIRGTTYPSTTGAAVALGVTTQAIYRARKEGKLDLVGTGRSKTRNRHGKPIRIAGVTYGNVASAARALGVSPSTIYCARRDGTLDRVGAKIRARLKAAEAAVNTPAVIGGTVRRAKPCVLCGATEGVSITYAIPLSEGGWDSEWNHNILCHECRRRREWMHLKQMDNGARAGMVTL